LTRSSDKNPGKFTLQGTNTYLVGETAPYTLIDTSDGRPAYIPLLECALEHGITPGGKTSQRQHISDIIISHWHPDHIGGLFSVLTLLKNIWDSRNTPLPFQPPRIHKFPHTKPLDDRFQRAIQHIEPGMYTPSPSGALFHDLHDGQSFPISRSDSSSDSDAIFRVIHAPGHTEASIALLFPSEQALYSADSILGQGTAVFEDLGTYLSTLRSLLSHIDESTVIYPAHGPVVHDGPKVIKDYIQHRMEREGQIVQALQQSGTCSTWEIVSKIYAAYPRDLWEPAARSVTQHLHKLVVEGKVEKLVGEGKDAQWKFRTSL